jgi:hypothetical protein
MRVGICLRRSPLALLLAAILLGVGGEARAQQTPAAEAPTGPWFHEMGGTLRLTDQHGAALCKVAWNALRSGGTQGSVSGADEIRAVFLSWSDGSETAKVAFGLGQGPVDALRAALAGIAPNDFPHDRLRWLKVDVVQSTVTIPRMLKTRTPDGDVVETEVPGYLARQCSLPAPSMLGVAFSPTSHLAFLPEQLLSRDMLDGRNMLMADSYAAQLGRENRMEEMVRWTRISALHAPQRVTFFETQAWFYDGVTCEPLYRGHRMYENPTRAQLVGILGTVANRLANAVDEEGRVKLAIPKWFGDPEGKVEPFNAALTILALSWAAPLVNDPEALLGAADRLAAATVKQIRIPRKGSKVGCFVEVDDEGAQGLRYTVRLSTNSLFALALCSLSSQRKGDEAKRYDAPLFALAHFIMAQHQEGGELVAERLWPTGKVLRRTDNTASALAVCALLALYEKTENRVFRDTALSVFNAVLPNAEAVPTDSLVQDEWFLRAADGCFTYQRDDRYAKQARRYVDAVTADQMRKPPFADFYGAVPALPSATASASRTGLIAVATRLVGDAQQDTVEQSRRLDTLNMFAQARPSLVCQLQGYMSAPEAMYLPEPGSYLGLFRDHVRAFGFDLQSQYAQILSLTEVVQTMDRLRVDSLSFPEAAVTKIVDDELAARRQAMASFPDMMRFFDGRLQTHQAAIPAERQEADEEKGPPPVVVPVPLWRTSTRGSDDAGPAVRPVDR